MNVFKRLIRLYRKHTYEYFFGFGADAEHTMIRSIIGHEPNIIDHAVLHDYQLCIQDLDDITTQGDNPREILRRAWGNSFRSYCIRPNKGEAVEGTLFRVTGYERKMIDAWELVPEGWQLSRVVRVRTASGRRVRARTQVLPPNQNHGQATDGTRYKHWLLPKEDFVRIAKKDATRYDSYVY